MKYSHDRVCACGRKEEMKAERKENEENTKRRKDEINNLDKAGNE
jgi:hypothetical protein